MDKFPSWTDDKVVKQLRIKLERLERNLKPELEKLAEARRQSEALRASLADGETSLLLGKLSVNDFLALKRDVAAATEKLEAGSAANETNLEALATIRTELAAAETKARQRVADDLKALYLPAAERLDAALAAAVEANGAVMVLWNAISSQFPDAMRDLGAVNLGFSRPLTAEGLAAWRRWRGESGLLPAEAQRAFDAERAAAEERRKAGEAAEKQRLRTLGEKAARRAKPLIFRYAGEPVTVMMAGPNDDGE